MHRKEPCTAQKEPCISKKEPCISPKEPCTIGKEQCVPVLYKRALYTLKRALYITIRTLFIKKKQYRLHMLQSAQFFPHFIYHLCFHFYLIIHKCAWGRSSSLFFPFHVSIISLWCFNFFLVIFCCFFPHVYKRWEKGCIPLSIFLLNLFF